jgi:hypothetical protein
VLAVFAAASMLALAVACEKSAPAVSHEVNGSISSLDLKKGLVVIDAEPAALRMSFAPESTEGLSVGDIVTAHMILAQEEGPAERAYDAPVREEESAQVDDEQPKVRLGQHSVMGTVTEIDHSTGVFNLEPNDETETLTFYFPPEEIRDLKRGEEVVLRITFTKRERG